MAITINGSGTITGVSAGGLPDGSITADDLASSGTFPAWDGSALTGLSAGSWSTIYTLDYSGSDTSSISVDNVFTDDYKYYQIFLTIQDNATDNLNIQLIDSNGSILTGSDYYQAGSRGVTWDGSTNIATSHNWGGTAFRSLNGSSNPANNFGYHLSHIFLNNLRDGTMAANIHWNTNTFNGTYINYENIGGFVNDNRVFRGIHFKTLNGNTMFGAGTEIRVLGLVE